MKTQTTATTALIPASIGSISHGTLRTEDLLAEFLSQLESMMLLNGDFYSLPDNRTERDRLTALIGEAQDCWNEDGDGLDPEKQDDAEYLVEESTGHLRG